MGYAKTGLFEFERGGTTILKAKGMPSLVDERVITKFKDANGESHALVGEREFVDFDVECREVSEFLWFWDWYSGQNPEAIDFAAHGKDQSKAIAYSIEFEDVIPRGFEVGGWDTESDNVPQIFTFKLTGKIVVIS